MADSKSPFYVGYLPLPAALRGPVRTWGLGVLALGAAVVAGIAVLQKNPGAGSIDWSATTEVEGVLHVDPYPVLYRGEADGPAQATLLVSELKFGVADRALEFDGQGIAVRGYPISRDGRRMLEVVADADALSPAPGAGNTTADRVVVGEHTLVGEIADSKCFLGVMKPGLGKTHRACAVRCISGGIAPVLITESEAGELRMYVLRGRDGSPMNEAVLPYVAEPVQLTGLVSRRGDLLFLDLDPAEIERL